MYTPAPLDHFGDLEKQRHAARLGVWVFLGSELLLFAALFTLYFGYRAHFPEIFEQGVAHNNKSLGSLNTAILLLSSLAIAIAVSECRRGRTRIALILTAATVLAALGFLLVKGTEYAQHFSEGIRPGGIGSFFDEHPERGWPIFFTLYFAMTGLHAIHVIVGGALLSWTGWWIVRDGVGVAGSHRLELCALYWHLVDVIWVFLWPMFYLMGGGR